MTTDSAAAGEPHEHLRHRALADASRRRMLAELALSGSLGVRDLAERLNLHQNTVRAHARVLVAAGLCVSEAGPAGERGRSRAVFRVVSQGGNDQGDDPANFRLLAEVLATTIAQGATDPDEIAAIAEAWGRHLADSPPPFSSTSADTALEQLVEMLSQLGFQPTLERDEAGAPDHIAMVPCPFMDLAERHPEIVCPVHLGLMRGALAELGGGVGIAELVPFAATGCCRAAIAPTARQATAATRV